MNDISASSLLNDIARGEQHESRECEFKRAKGGLPKEIWPTVSAFANTSGGYLLLGVDEQEGRAVATGVDNPDAQLQDFFNQIHNTQKISYPVCGQHDVSVERVDGRAVVIIHVPPAPRQNRPVFINNNPYQVHFRNFTGDRHATRQEADRIRRDASDIPTDRIVLPQFGIDDFVGDQHQVLSLGLGDQHAVKRITVTSRQTACSLPMIPRDGATQAKQERACRPPATAGAAGSLVRA